MELIKEGYVRLNVNINNKEIIEDEFCCSGGVGLMRVKYSKENMGWEGGVNIGNEKIKLIDLTPVCMNPSSGYASALQDYPLDIPFKKGDKFIFELPKKTHGQVESIILYLKYSAD